jgi:hypothetical protein
MEGTMVERVAVMTGLLVGMVGWGGVALGQSCTPAECMTNGMCTVGGECEGTPVSGGICDDADSCTTNDACVSGVCMGTPSSGGDCDDFNPCTTNDRCTNGTCGGTAVTNGSPCGDPGCEGTCLTTPGMQFCILDAVIQGQPCTDQFGNCTTNDRCLGFTCIGTFTQCPDVDQNPCTFEFCNFDTGQCENGFPLCSECETCDPQTGDCLPGVAAGTPTSTRTGGPSTPTATRTVSAGTPTVPATVTATVPAATPTRPRAGPCVADCNEDGEVSVDEIVFATQIALGLASVGDCPAADFDEDQQVTVDELLQAVQALLGGCLS